MFSDSATGSSSCWLAIIAAAARTSRRGHRDWDRKLLESRGTDLQQTRVWSSAQPCKIKSLERRARGGISGSGLEWLGVATSAKKTPAR